MAKVAFGLYSDEGTREVKNLGWLLRHASELHTVAVTVNASGSAKVLAVGKGRRVWQYRTDFASANVLRDWLRRPTFDGVFIDWQAADGWQRVYAIDFYRQGYRVDATGVLTLDGARLRESCRP